MKITRKAVFALAVLVLALPAATQNWSPQPGSWLSVSGTSTLHDWEVRTEKLEGKIAFPAEFIDTGEGKVVAEVLIPTGSLKSHSARMDRNMYKALDADSHPKIRYELMNATWISASAASTEGTLTIAGKTLPVRMEVTLSQPEADILVVSGTVPINMREFGIDPPTAMLGTIRTGENVEVAFQWKLKLR